MSITIELKKPIQYGYKGELTTGAFITLNPPTSKNLKQTAFLKQAFYRAMKQNQIDSGLSSKELMELAEDQGPEKEENLSDVMTAQDIMQAITAASNVELDQVLIMGVELLSSGVALIEGEEKLTKPIINEEMAVTDLENLVGAYIANFTLT